MNELANLSVGTAAKVGLLGYAVVFLGLILLMLVIILTSRIMMRRTKKAAPAVSAASVEVQPAAAVAAGTAGELKLYGTNPRDAAMVMAIVAQELQAPLNELRFISIKEIKNDDI